jgi:hypothetical protein
MSGTNLTTVNTQELNNLRRDAERLRALRHDVPQLVESAMQANEAIVRQQVAPLIERQNQFEREISGLNNQIYRVEADMAQRVAQHAEQTRQAIYDVNNRMEQQRQELRYQIQTTAAQLEQAIAAGDEQTRAQLRSELQAAETRLRQLNQETLQVVYEQDRRLSAAIDNERQIRQQQMHALEGMIAAEQAAREAMGQDLQNQIEIERQVRERQVRGLQTEIDAMHQDRARLAGVAREYTEAAQTIRNFIDNHYRHQQFTPNQLARLDTVLQTALDNLDRGAPEAALSEAQRAYQGLSDLRIELERLDNEWRRWHETALLEARKLLIQAQSNRRLKDVDQSGELGEVDYWTGGKLAELEQEINQAIDRALDEKYILSIEELREMARDTIPGLDRRLDEIIVEAQMKIISSQIRVNIADLAVQALEEQGYTIQDGAYQGEDMRNGFFAKVINREGIEVVVGVVPEGDANRMEIHYYDKPVNPGEHLSRAQETARSMRRKGLEVAEPTCAGDEPDLDKRDIDKIRKSKPVQKTRI